MTTSVEPVAAPAPAEGGPSALRRFVLPMIFVIGLFVALFLRQPDIPTLWTFTGQTMGTTYAVKVVPPPDLATNLKARADAARTIKETLVAVNASMSTYQKDSELSKFNASTSTAATSISKPLSIVLAEALRLSALSDGAFDVTVGPMVNAWGFGPSDPGTPPDAEQLKHLEQIVGVDKISLAMDADPPTLSKGHPEVYVDLSAIAKGHGVDRVAEALEALGHERYMVEIGGEVRTRGKNDIDALWRIGIEKPDSTTRVVHEALSLDNVSLASSGNYRNFYEKDGVRISHTINPKTGQPVTHRLASVSVVHKTCMSADGLATTLNVLGEEEGYALALKHNLAALFIVKTQEGAFVEKATPAFETLRAQTKAKERP